MAGRELGARRLRFKRLQSRIAKHVRKAILRDGTTDTGCGLKAFRAISSCGCRIRRPAPVPAGACPARGLCDRAVEVRDRDRRHGVSNYGMWNRLWVGVLDLMGVWWLIHRRRIIPSVKEMQPMLVDLSRMIGTYLQDVFVNTLDGWVLIGVIAQLFFTARFVVQWLASERAGSQRDSGGVLDSLLGRRRDVVDLCDFIARIRSSSPDRPSAVRVFSQFATRVAKSSSSRRACRSAGFVTIHSERIVAPAIELLIEPVSCVFMSGS